MQPRHYTTRRHVIKYAYSNIWSSRYAPATVTWRRAINPAFGPINIIESCAERFSPIRTNPTQKKRLLKIVISIIIYWWILPQVFWRGLQSLSLSKYTMICVNIPGLKWVVSEFSRCGKFRLKLSRKKKTSVNQSQLSQNPSVIHKISPALCGDRFIVSCIGVSGIYSVLYRSVWHL